MRTIHIYSWRVGSQLVLRPDDWIDDWAAVLTVNGRTMSHAALDAVTYAVAMGRATSEDVERVILEVYPAAALIFRRGPLTQHNYTQIQQPGLPSDAAVRHLAQYTASPDVPDWRPTETVPEDYYAL